MRTYAFVLAMFAALAAATAFAHGPQIQITNDGGKIVTRQLIADGPYSNSLTPPKSVYVMPLLPIQQCVVFAAEQRDRSDSGRAGVSVGAGFCVWIRLADGGPAVRNRQRSFAGVYRWFEAMERIGVCRCRATQLKAFRGSNANIASPPENFATTSDSGPFDSLDLPTVAANYGAEGAEVHTSLRFALLGDGTDPLSVSAGRRVFARHAADEHSKRVGGVGSVLLRALQERRAWCWFSTR